MFLIKHSRDELLKELKITKAEIAVLKENEVRVKYNFQEINLFKALSILISESHSLLDVFNKILAKICGLTDWSFGQVWTLCSSGEYLECSQAFYLRDYNLKKLRTLSEDFKLQKGVGLPGKAWESKNSFYAENKLEDKYNNNFSIIVEDGFSHRLVIPIFFNDELLAVFEFFVTDEKSKNTQLLMLVEKVLNQIAPILRRKQIEEKIIIKTKYLEKQNKILQKLTKSKVIQSGDLITSFNKITEASAESLYLERSGVWLFNDKRNKVRCFDLYELSKQSHSQGMELYANKYPIYFSALESKEIIDAHYAHTDKRTEEFSFDYLTPLGIRSMLDVPIWFQGNLVGVLCNEHVGGTRVWSQEEICFVASLSEIITISLESSNFDSSTF